MKKNKDGITLLFLFVVPVIIGLFLGIYQKYYLEPKRIEMVIEQLPNNIDKNKVIGNSGHYEVETNEKGTYYTVNFDLQHILDIGKIKEIKKVNETKVVIKKSS